VKRFQIAAVLGVLGLAVAACGDRVQAGNQATAVTQTLVASGGATGAPVTPVRMLTAQQVVDAFTSAGLKAPKPRDNSKNCASLGCTQMITTDALTVVSFPDGASASRYAQAAPDTTHQLGLVVLSYTAARTPAADRPKYEKELEKLAS
jgi:hypothetical protein